MKKLISLLLVCISMLMPASAFADEITVLVNGEQLVTDVAPQIVNDRTMLPMRAIFEALGANVSWVEKDRLIFATKGEYMIVMQIDNNQMSVQTVTSDENTAISLDVAPFIYNSRTLVPVRAVAESLDAQVDWVAETRTVIINTK